MAVSATSTAVSNQNNPQSDTKQRTTNPGVRIINGKIYDSENGKSCHQCRQKTRSFAASCKNQKNDKPCSKSFCHTCLWNRYGEKAEAVDVLEDWSCPKCRGICNCSYCRKKQGHEPTGILSHRAKATGYSSVSELLHANGPENFGLTKNVKDTGASPKKPSASDKKIASPRMKGKENLVDGRADMNLESLTPSKSKELKKMQGVTLENDSLSKCRTCPNKKSKKTKQGTSKPVLAGQKEAAALKGCSSGASLENRFNKSRVLTMSNHIDEKPNGKVDDLKVGDGCTMNVSTEVQAEAFRNKKRNADEDIEEPANKKTKKQEKQDIGGAYIKGNIKGSRSWSRDVGFDIPLPHGTELITIGDVELPPEDVGNALQFLEFCAAFGKTLNMKKGQSNTILRELVNGQTRTLRRSEQHSPLVHFHIQLLSLLQESDSRPQKISPSRGRNYWLLALKNCLSESANAIDSLPIDCLDRETGGYHTLDSSTKLRIVIFLCDEVLETERIRAWINKQEEKLVQKAKQAKEKVLAAKDKEKSLKQKVMNELAEAVIARDGAPLSISEHDEIVSQIEFEAAQAHKEMLESMNMVPKAKERSQAVRTRPILVDIDGRAFWRLNCYSEESSILAQEIGNGDDLIVFGEKWITFDDEQQKVVERHISFRDRMSLHIVCIATTSSKVKSGVKNCCRFVKLQKASRSYNVQVLSDLFAAVLRIRDWITVQEIRFAVKAKQAKDRVVPAKDKVNYLPPTGILCLGAKATGYSCVSELLHAKAIMLEHTGTSPKNQSAS
ncbi:Zinc-finger domain of monoamine-oxidase A repressor R1 [Heracleum sosnowskyi]|uniref:Zinc-finger domain of monoamine-oxidase A repressor R1 n=1 Tax=Heracleum sosnowskyi TaxID=360622 RepID=A0AAD8GZG2_9APIA|nr:Zinc-finger domain of monoamine-oxidase A repressor R1 [Heracleum sosnowskyi]